MDLKVAADAQLESQFRLGVPGNVLTSISRFLGSRKFRLGAFDLPPEQRGSDSRQRSGLRRDQAARGPGAGGAQSEGEGAGQALSGADAGGAEGVLLGHGGRGGASRPAALAAAANQSSCRLRTPAPCTRTWKRATRSWQKSSGPARSTVMSRRRTKESSTASSRSTSPYRTTVATSSSAFGPSTTSTRRAPTLGC